MFYVSKFEWEGKREDIVCFYTLWQKQSSRDGEITWWSYGIILPHRLYLKILNPLAVVFPFCFCLLLFSFISHRCITLGIRGYKRHHTCKLRNLLEGMNCPIYIIHLSARSYLNEIMWTLVSLTTISWPHTKMLSYFMYCFICYYVAIYWESDTHRCLYNLALSAWLDILAIAFQIFFFSSSYTKITWQSKFQTPMLSKNGYVLKCIVDACLESCIDIMRHSKSASRFSKFCITLHVYAVGLRCLFCTCPRHLMWAFFFSRISCEAYAFFALQSKFLHSRSMLIYKAFYCPLSQHVNLLFKVREYLFDSL